MPAPTSPATDRSPSREAPRPPRERNGGFTLIEVVLALAVVSLLAALALPAVRPGGGRAMLNVKASEIASLLRADRDAALSAGRMVTTSIDLPQRSLAAGASGRTLALPARMDVRVVPPGLEGVRFSGDGRSSGGRIELGAREGGVAVSVNPLTAAVSVEAY